MTSRTRHISFVFCLMLTALTLHLTSTTSYSQCTASAGFVCMPQTDVDRIAKDLNELKAIRDAYNKLLVERGLSAAERQAASNLATIANETIVVLQKGITDRDAVITLQQKALQLYSDLVEKLTNQMNKPKSAFSKFLTALKEIAYLAAGLALGRGL